jgi:hypothetical protein
MFYMSRDQRKTRVNRIERRGIPAIREAFESGRITARRADFLLHLEPARALSELTALLAKQDRIRLRSKIAAGVINEHLRSGRPDLQVLQTHLRQALS